MKTEDPDERTWLKGLAVECPFGEALPNCPLNGLRSNTYQTDPKRKPRMQYTR